MNYRPDPVVVPIEIDRMIVRVHLPADLTVPEAEKICRVVMAYAAPVPAYYPDEVQHG